MPYMENVEKPNGTHTEEQKGIKRYHLRRKTIKFQNNLQTYTNINEKSSNFVCDLQDIMEYAEKP